MSNAESIREVASFYYSHNGPQTVAFESFIKDKKNILRKISTYDFDEWSEAIHQGTDIEEVLCYLVVNYGHGYNAMKARSSKARLHLLQVWEQKWGTLPTKWRVGFVRHSGFTDLQWFDIEILEYMFTQHRKFESVLDHLINLQKDSDIQELTFDFNSEDHELGSLTTSESDSEPNFDHEGISSLSVETKIPLDWNLDDLDTDEILPIWDEELSY